jgi:hypothetical protein
VAFIILAIIFIPAMANIDFYVNDLYGYYLPDSGLTSILIPSFILISLMSLLVYGDRTKRQMSDTYKQLPFKGNSYRVQKSLVALILFLLVFTLVYRLGVAILYSRQVNAVEKEGYTLVKYHFIWYLLAYLFIILELSVVYFTVLFFVSLSDEFLDQLLMVIVYLTLMNGIIYFPLLYIFQAQENFSSIDGSSRLSLSYTQNIRAITKIFDSRIISDEIPRIYDQAMFYSGLILTNLCGVVSFLWIYFVKEPSGEYAGKAGARNILISLVIPLTFLFLYFGVAVLIEVSSGILFYQLFIFLGITILFYISLVLYERSFKLNKTIWIGYASVVIIGALLTRIIA